MSEPFNATHAVRFDLGRGRVSVGASEGGGGEARVLIPADALRDLCQAAGSEDVKDFGRRVGTEIGRRVAARLGDGSGIGAMVEHLGGDLALAGLGSLGAEVWGQALVFTIQGSPLGKDGDALLAAILEGALQRAVGRDSAVVPINHTDDKSRLVVVNRATGSRVREWLAEGVSWGDALSRLSAAR
jgi:hypothetical protein